MRKWKIKKFEELSLNELYSIMRSRNIVFVGEQKITSEKEMDEIDDKCIHVFYENEEGKIGAYCRIVPEGVKYENISIGRVLVADEFRRQGIAREMMEKTIEYIEENHDHERIELAAQLYAKNLYESVGFTQQSDVYDELGIPHVRMLREKKTVQ